MVAFLPKFSRADKIQQYRPIYFLRRIYKWITKTLNLRLDPYADKLFSVHGSVFLIKNMNIMDGLLSLNENLHHTYVKEQVETILKLDFEKAYDKVN